VVFRNFGLEYALRVLVRLSSVHRDRLSQPHGMTELSCKDFSLNVPWRIVIVVIETDLAPSYIAGMSHGFKTVVVRVLSKNTRIAMARGRVGRKIIHVFLDIVGIGLCFMPMYTIRAWLIAWLV
jgi:hypothetical protein